ncbi:hypothetical protein [Novosphingobium sp.]|uniref:hypothetical protein n=1 Tax=Novosphingobium sp. TaxID=1874826 RepID=UPI002638D81F|nr:hypothetical protein [Novosphingobium sp.]
MAQSLAAKLRRHREEMELALQLKVTPREARAILDQRAARARWEETHLRLQARMRGITAPHGDAERAQPWYQQGAMA